MKQRNNKTRLDSSTNVESSIAASSYINEESSMAASSSTSPTIDLSEDTLRIYCCGTNFDETNRGELISELYHYDYENNSHPENIMVLAGAGKAGFNHSVAGLADGFKDMDTNASSAADWVYKQLYQKVISEGKREVNILLSGWSRGGITAYIISNELDDVIAKIKKECSNPDELTINVKLFVVDPVAGPTNGERRRLARLLPNTKQREDVWQKMYNLGQCVNNAEVFYAENEKRMIMRPVFVNTTNNNTKLTEMSLEGKHSSLVQANNEQYEDSINIVCKAAEFFYKANGIAQNTSQVFEIGAQKAKRQTSSFTVFNAFKSVHTPSEVECSERKKGFDKTVSTQHVQMIKNFKEAYNNSAESKERIERRFNPSTNASSSNSTVSEYSGTLFADKGQIKKEALEHSTPSPQAW